MYFVRNFAFVVIAGIAATSAAADVRPCAPPAGFVDAPHPPIAPAEQLVSHQEEIVIARAYGVVSAAMNKPLNQAIHQSSSLPGVSGDYMLTQGEFGAPGSRHIVCLTDGGSVEEESLEREGTPNSGRFRYIVWNFYATPKARDVDVLVQAQGEYLSWQSWGFWKMAVPGGILRSGLRRHDAWRVGRV